ncbi:aldehyde dehydrogenase family protein [Verrucomicrobiaceae bacterium R5-34]|uniref:Aldehyde dehydrogenase n=1 Tax=Oceaniferula flava TaxID=2800421 RepID=A0AAE2SAQ4_9BACT|nr:aldehyde dehydrogenase family protein [Oceaniferula flavus]MBK1830534.1 aldehyde dehydrogenase family protein [Verrucomicrobiaceae bacterium R5-34]MBK1854630.1 aldehyde dehydrogenase family protein [Oceaniferula flavus]MBM1135936.1 aldehyde dehydrogenase family protein [Oceaniferula flavus]
MAKDKTEDKIDELLERQKTFFTDGGTRSYVFRIEALECLENQLTDHRDDILQALADDLGKPGMEAFVAEYHFLLEELRLIKKSLRKWLKPKRVSSAFYLHPCRSEIRNEPFGAALIMAPWNYPIQLSFSPLMAAIAAGNTVVLKPSEVSTACEKLIVKIVQQSFSPEHVAVVTGDADVAEALLERPFDFFFFTGSTAIGRIVASKAVEQLAPCVLELGGKCPAVVDQSADLEVAALRILTGKFFNGGQTCFAPDFIAVHDSVKDQLIEEIRKVLDAVRWNGEMAHVINSRQYDRLKKLTDGVANMIQQGDDREASLEMAPRVMPDVGWEDEVMEEEIFGPILPVVRFQSEAELIQRLSNYGSPLALYLFTNSDSFTQKMTTAIRSGGVCVNDTMKQGAHLKLPFGGVGESGYGRYRGRSGLETFTYQRGVVKKPTWGPDWFDPRPPYGDKLKWLKRFLR